MSDSELSNPEDNLDATLVFKPSNSSVSTPLKRGRGRPKKNKRRSVSLPRSTLDLSTLLSSSNFSVPLPPNMPDPQEPPVTQSLETLLKTPLIHPSKFSGSEDVDDFFTSIENACKVNSWKLDIVPFLIEKYLSNTALTYFKFLKTKTPDLKYESFKKDFLQQFKDDDLQN